MNITKYILFVVFILMFLINSKSQNGNMIIGRWEHRDSSEISLFLEFYKNTKDSLSFYGQHVFVFYNGNRIDFCSSDDTTLSIIHKDNKYFGSFQSCYENEVYDIEISIISNSLNLFFINNDYILYQDTLIFKREINK